jgi:hypothetical protein
LMLATVEDAGADSQINIWDLTTKANTTPLGTVTLSGDATPTSIAAAMGYIIVGSEDGISIIDPHSGAWAERTKGWPRTLSSSTTPALTNNDVEGVAAGFSDQPAYDPRTDGPLPTFACSYGTGADIGSIIKDDGNVFDKSGTVDNGAICLLQNGKVGLGDSSGDIIRISKAPISSITADDWAHGGYGATGIAQPMPGLGAQNAIDGQGNLTVAASASGLTSLLGVTPPSLHGNVESDPNAATAMMTRTYNTGYLGPSIRGAWLANSKTTDHSTRVNTLTENGTVTEAVVESGAELKGYSGFSSSNYLSRSSDADWDSFGTGPVYVSIWFKCSGNSNYEDFFSFMKTDSSVGMNMELYTDGTLSCGFKGASGTALLRNTTLVLDDNVWHKADAVRVGTAETYFYIDGVLVDSNTTTTGSMTDSGVIPLAIGVGAYATTYPATTTTLSLARLSAGAAPSATLVREMYEAEKGMFVASAECLLQSGSTDAVLDVNVDPLTGKVLVTQTDAITVFDGFVVDSKPTVNSGSSEKGKLWGDLRAEQNSANAYVTAPADDQRQVNEMVRGLANDMPGGIDLSKAKAWLFYDNSTQTIYSSYNIKSVTDVGTALFKCYFAIPFKTKYYSCAGMVIAGGGNFITGNDSLANHSRDKFYGYIDGGDGGSAGDFPIMMVFFGELENE